VHLVYCAREVSTANSPLLGPCRGVEGRALLLVQLGAYLHDVEDYKYSGDDESAYPLIVSILAEAVSAAMLHVPPRSSLLAPRGRYSRFPLVTIPLASQGYDATIQHSVCEVVRGVSFHNELARSNAGATTGAAPEIDEDTMRALRIVQDADRLDAIGAIGIARCFTYGGAKHRELHDPSIPPMVELDRKAYMARELQGTTGAATGNAAASAAAPAKKAAGGTTINHFYEKLLKLKDLMKTDAGKRRAAARHAFLELYLDQFHAEWDGSR
jgi:uncharacterized protein